MMGKAKQMAPNVKEIGSKYMEKDAILVTKCQVHGQRNDNADAIRIDCLEKKPHSGSKRKSDRTNRSV
jgi:hypothetical protein